MSDDDDYDDSLLSGQDMIDVLDYTEQSLVDTFLQSPAKSTKAGALVQEPKLDLQPPSVEQGFSDASVNKALQEAETQVIGSRVRDGEKDDVVTLTRADLEQIKRNAFNAGRMNASKPPVPFPLLSLPVELRLTFYKHYFADRNPITAGREASALPNRLSDKEHCCSSDNTWCKTMRPWISTALVSTCKQIYHETRDEYLYQSRRFKATVESFDMAFREIRPHLRFWQYIQHLELEIRSQDNSRARYETGTMIVHLIAMLRGGQNMRSFKLKYAATNREESIMRFKDLSVCGNVHLTQIFRDWTKPSDKEMRMRKDRLERLLFSILGCDSYAAPPYDVITSTADDGDDDIPFGFESANFETYITILTSEN